LQEPNWVSTQLTSKHISSIIAITDWYLHVIQKIHPII